MSKLKPCPFCKSKNIKVVCYNNQWDELYAIGCETRDCHLKINELLALFHNPNSAIISWNNRFDDITKEDYESRSTWFGKLINSLSPLNKITRTKSLAYICRNKKHNADGIVVKFNKKHWIIIKDDGTWDHIRSHGHSTVDKIRKGI